MTMNYQDRIFDSIEAQKSSIQHKEKARKEKPTAADLKETVKLFDDFGMNVNMSEIPSFSSAYELEKWRVKKIVKFLGSH